MAKLPADGSPGVAATTTKLEIKFDRFMLPTDAIRQSMCLHSSAKSVVKLADCAAAEFLEPHYDPVARVVTYYQSDPAGLVAGQLYTAAIFRWNGESGLRAFDGVPLDRTYEFSFTAAAPADAMGAPVDGVAIEAPARGGGYCGDGGCTETCLDGAAAVLRGSCDQCHADEPGTGSKGKLYEQAMGLRLRSIAGLQATAIDKVAHETERGGAANKPAANPLQFGVAMPIIKSASPGESYLLYKLLVNDDPVIAVDPNDPDDKLADGELERLRRTVVVGLAMPPKSTFSLIPQGGAPADGYENLRKISAWIDQGAELPRCPAP
jgi:hypothetical protein